jgi:hypothetical protein
MLMREKLLMTSIVTFQTSVEDFKIFEFFGCMFGIDVNNLK